MSADINNYVPMYMNPAEEEPSKGLVTHVEWNNAWRLIIEQGNYSMETLVALIARLKATTDNVSGADFIKATAIAGLAGVTVQALLESIKAALDNRFTKAELRDATSLSAGAYQIGISKAIMPDIPNIADYENVRTFLAYFVDYLKRTVDGSSGADLIGATTIPNALGNTVQAILENLAWRLENHKINEVHPKHVPREQLLSIGAEPWFYPGATLVGALCETFIPGFDTGMTVQSFLNAIITRLRSTTDGSSGADFVKGTAIPNFGSGSVQQLLENIANDLTLFKADLLNNGNELPNFAGAEMIGLSPGAGMPFIPGMDTYTTIRDFLNKFVTYLGRTVDGSSGANFIGATALPGLVGTNVQTQLESLKTYVDDASLGLAGDSPQMKGFAFDLPTYYGNTKLCAMFQDDETWVSGAGTQSNDVVSVKLGRQGLKILENDNVSSYLHSSRNNISLDLTKFNNGEPVTDDDYICVFVYISDATKLKAASTGIRVYFDNAAAFDGNNCYFYSVTSSALVTGWNYIKIKRGDFSTTGAPSWATIQSINARWQSADNAQNAYVSYQLIQLVKKDPLAAAPNPYQVKINGVWTTQLTLESGEWIIGMENGELVCRNILPATAYNSLRYIIQPYKDFTSFCAEKCLTPQYVSGPSWYYNVPNNVSAFIDVNVLYLRKRESNVYTDVTCQMPVDVGDTVEYIFSKNGSTLSVTAFKNGDRTKPYVLVTETSISTEGYLGLKSRISTYCNILALSVSTVNHSQHSSISDLTQRLLNNWKNWVPTLTWTTATPAINVVTKSRYTVIGNTVYFNFYYKADDGNGATALKISLPVTPKDNDSIINVYAQQKVNTTWANRMAYIDDDDGNGIQFRDFAACTDAQSVEVIVSGFYEIA